MTTEPGISLYRDVRSRVDLGARDPGQDSRGPISFFMKRIALSTGWLSFVEHCRSCFADLHDSRARGFDRAELLLLRVLQDILENLPPGLSFWPLRRSFEGCMCSLNMGPPPLKEEDARFLFLKDQRSRFRLSFRKPFRLGVDISFQRLSQVPEKVHTIMALLTFGKIIFKISNIYYY